MLGFNPGISQITDKHVNIRPLWTLQQKSTCKIYALSEPQLLVLISSTAVVLAAVARRNLKAMSVLQDTEVQRSDRNIRRREIDWMKTAWWRWTERFMGLWSSDLDGQLLTVKHTHTQTAEYILDMHSTNNFPWQFMSTTLHGNCYSDTKP